MDDFIRLNDQLTDEEKLIQQSVRHFVDDTILPNIAKAWEQAIFPKEWVAELARLGLFGMTLPASMVEVTLTQLVMVLPVRNSNEVTAHCEVLFQCKIHSACIPFFNTEQQHKKTLFCPKWLRATSLVVLV